MSQPSSIKPPEPSRSVALSPESSQPVSPHSTLQGRKITYPSYSSMVRNTISKILNFLAGLKFWGKSFSPNDDRTADYSPHSEPEILVRKENKEIEAVKKPKEIVIKFSMSVKQMKKNIDTLIKFDKKKSQFMANAQNEIISISQGNADRKIQGFYSFENLPKAIYETFLRLHQGLIEGNISLSTHERSDIIKYLKKFVNRKNYKDLENNPLSKPMLVLATEVSNLTSSTGTAEQVWRTELE